MSERRFGQRESLDSGVTGDGVCVFGEINPFSATVVASTTTIVTGCAGTNAPACAAGAVSVGVESGAVTGVMWVQSQREVNLY